MPGLGADQRIRRLELGVLAAGVVIRAVRFLEPRPLWIDEVLIALNVLPHGPADFLRPLEHSQISPLGFLLGEWLVTRVAGTGEHALRFLPFVASVVALIAFSRLARRTLEPGTALFATALAALSPLLIIYASEVKSYAFDCLCAVLLMHGTLSAAGGRPGAWQRWGLIAGFGALMSTAATFFIAGCALSLLAVRRIRAPRELLRLASAVVPAAFLFGMQYVTTYDSPYTRAVMESYWTRNFLDASLPDALLQGARFARTFVIDVVFGDRIANALPPKSMTLIVLLTAIGAVLLVRRSLQVGAMIFAPAALAVAAALMHRWPLTSRLLLFLVPALAMALSSGVAGVTRLLPSRIRGPAFAVMSAAFLAGSAAGLRPEWNENSLVIALPAALRHVNQSRDPNATVYFSSDLVPACRYYLAWHPDRTELGGSLDTGARADTTTMCSLRDGTALHGRWPAFVRRPAGAPWDTPMPIQPEWLEGEGSRLLAAPGSDLWLLLGHSRQLRESLPAWLETHGLKRASEQQRRVLLLVEYTKAGGGGD